MTKIHVIFTNYVVRLKSKIKSVFIFLIFALCICGVLFIRDGLSPVKKNVAEIIAPIKNDKQDLSGAMRELEKCQSELFFIKNDNEKLKVIPDARKDIISLLLIMRDIENKVGKQKDLSNECVKLFATASRVPEIQEIASKYKENLFNTRCQIAMEEEVLALVMPFEIGLLDKKYEDKDKKEDGKIVRLLNKIIHKTSKTTKEMKIQNNSPLENLIMKKQYENALKIIEERYKEYYAVQDGTISVPVRPEYRILHDAIESLYVINKMIDDLYVAIRKVEDYV